MKHQISVKTAFLSGLVLLVICLLAIPAHATVWMSDYHENSVTVSWNTPEETVGIYVEEPERLSTINWDGTGRGKTVWLGKLLNFTIEWGEGIYNHSDVVNADARSYTINGLNPGTAIDVRVTYKFLVDADGKFYYGFHGTTVATTLEAMTTYAIPEPSGWEKYYYYSGAAGIRFPAAAPHQDKEAPGTKSGYECYIVGGPEPKINPNNEYPQLGSGENGAYRDGHLSIVDNKFPVSQYGVVTVSIRPYLGRYILKYDYSGNKIWSSGWDTWSFYIEYKLGAWTVCRIVADADFRVTRKKNYSKLKKNSLTVTISPVKYARHYDIYVSELTKRGKAKKWKKAASVHTSDGQRVKKKITKIKGKYINPRKSYAVKVVTVSSYGKSNGDNQRNVY